MKMMQNCSVYKACAQGGMEKADSERLGDITRRILLDPDHVDSGDFMEGYNTIYRVCTQPTEKYEIKGACVYEMLKGVLVEYLRGLENFSSIETFNRGFTKFRRSAKILESVYDYIERYYIRTCIMKGEKNIQEISDLLYSSYYFVYVSKLEFLLRNMILIELVNIRVGSGDLNELVSATRTYKTLVLGSNCEEKLEELKGLYLDGFRAGVDIGAPVENLIFVFFAEIQVASQMFDREPHKTMGKRLVSMLLPRVDEIIEHSIGEVRCKRVLRNTYQILEMMGSKYVETFAVKLDRFIDAELRTCRKFDSFFEFFVYLDNNAVQVGQTVAKTVYEKFSQVMKAFVMNTSSEEVARFNELIVEKIENMSKEWSAEYVRSTLRFLNLLEHKDTIIDTITFNMQRRLLMNERSMTEEERLVEQLLGVMGHEDLSKLRVSLGDMIFSMKFNTVIHPAAGEGSGGGTRGFEAEPKFLTSGFWHLKSDNIRLFGELGFAQKCLVESLKARKRRAFVAFNHAISVAILELNAHRIELQTNVASLLLLIESLGAATFEILEQMTLDRSTGGHLHVLCQRGLVTSGGGRFSVNWDYDYGDARIFESKYTRLGRPECFSLVNIRINNIVRAEAEIAKFMKREQLCERSLLAHEMALLMFQCDEIEDAMHNLEKNEYIKISGSSVRYIP